MKQITLPKDSPRILWHNGIAYSLSPRELQILDLYSRGYSVSEIAGGRADKSLFLSVKTVSTYLFRVRDTLGIDSTNRLLVWAVERRLRNEHTPTADDKP